MPGYLLTAGSIVQCLHGGQASFQTRSPVKIAGQPVLTRASVTTVSGCTLPPPAGGPCVTAMWTVAATKIKIAGQPALLRDSQAQCAPTGTGVTVLGPDTRVRGE